MKTYVIAEAGTGHYAEWLGHRVALAEAFVTAAQVAGADAVKFQMFVPDEALFCPLPGDDERMENRWRGTMLPFPEWEGLKYFAEERGIDLLWSVFQPTAVKWLKDLKPKYVKVASRATRAWYDHNFYHALPGPFLVSRGFGAPIIPADADVYLLQCASEYPASLEKSGFNTRWSGLSDHSGTIWPGLDAIAHGAKMLEVHFKIPGADMGNDEPACITTDQLKTLCEARDAFARMHQD